MAAGELYLKRDPEGYDFLRYRDSSNVEREIRTVGYLGAAPAGSVAGSLWYEVVKGTGSLMYVGRTPHGVRLVGIGVDQMGGTPQAVELFVSGEFLALSVDYGGGALYLYNLWGSAT